MIEQPNNTAQDETPLEDVYDIGKEEMKTIIDHIHEENVEALGNDIADYHPADMAELISALSKDDRYFLIKTIKESFDPEILTELEHPVADEVIQYLGSEQTAAAISQLDTDDALDVIEDLHPESQQEILNAVSEESRSDLQEGLAYPEYSAARLMQKKFLGVPQYWKVGDIIDHLRSGEHDLPQDFYVMFIMDPKFRPIGYVSLSNVMQHHRDVAVDDIMIDELRTVPTEMDQEEVARIFRKYGIVECPVLNPDGRMVGVITVDDIVHVIEEEDEEDIMRLGGLTQTDFHESLSQSFKKRFPWLFINLLTAIAASWIIAVFETTIETWVALAVLMPIIASMGGNAGIQSVTVAVRAITTKELKTSNAMYAVRKELLIGIANGVSFAVIMGIAVFIIYQDAMLAAIFGLSTIVTMMMAGLMGAIIPMIMEKMNADPAVASGVFLTMLTDMIGFFAFLGLAALVLSGA